jgi:hypothetical protein
MTTPDVRVRLSADGVQEVVQALRRVEKEADRTAGRSATGFAALRNTLGGVARLIPALSFAAVGVGLLRAGNNALQFGDNLEEASRRAGVGARAMSELAFAASTVGVDLGGTSKALKEMQVTLSQAATGSKSANATLTALGLTLGDLQGLSADQQFERFADQIARIPDPADRARVATDLFGRSGLELIPILERGSVGIRELREQAVRLGKSVSDEQAKALAEGAEAVERLKNSFDGLAIAIGARAAPALTGFFDRLRVRLAGTELERLQLDISALEKAISGMRTDGGDAPVRAQLEAQLAELRAAERRLKDPAGGRRRRSQAETRGARPLPPPPGPQPDAERERRPADRLEDDPLFVRVNAQKIVIGELEQFYRDLDKQTQTSTERAVAGYQQQLAAIEELQRAGRITPEEAAARRQEAVDAVLGPIEITQERIEVATQEISEFQREAMRGTQQIIADALTNGFEGGARGILRSFGNLLQQLAAQAVAARLAEQLFGTTGTGGSAGGFLQSAFKFLGFADGGYVRGPGSGTSDSIPARLSNGEYVVPARAVAQPGVLPALEALRRGSGLGVVRSPSRGRYATGGLVDASGATPERMVVQQTINIQTERGARVSLATQQQVAAAAARGLTDARRRNG